MEIITLQFGPLSNAVGTHFWNIQEAEASARSSSTSSAEPKPEPRALSRSFDVSVLFPEAKERLRRECCGSMPQVPLFHWPGPGPQTSLISHSDNFGGLSLSGNVTQNSASNGDAGSQWAGSTNVVRQEFKRGSFIRALDDAAEQFSYFNALKSGSQRARDPREARRERLRQLRNRELALSAEIAQAPRLERDLLAIQRELRELELDLIRMDIRHADFEGKPVDSALRSTFLDFGLDDDATHWSDYLKSFVDAKSIQHLPSSEFSPFSSNSAQLWISGEEALRKPDLMEEVETSIHWILEECDRVAGLNVLMDDAGAFGSLAVAVLATFHDEIPRSRVVTTSLSLSRTDPIPTLGRALSMQKLSDLSTTYLPLVLDAFPSLPYLTPASSWREYQSSAVVAAALETLVQPIKYGQSSFGEVADALTPSSSKFVASVDVALPFAAGSTSPLTTLLDRDKHSLFNAPFMTPLSPLYKQDQHAPWSSVPIFTLSPPGAFKPDHLFGSPKHAIFSYLSNHTPSSRLSFVTPASVSAPISFPRFFSSRMSAAGLLLPSHDQRPAHEIVQSFPMVAHFQTSSRQQPYLASLAAQVDTAAIEVDALRELELSLSDVAELRSFALSVAEAYQPF